MESFQNEIRRIKQLLINNGFPNNLFDQETKYFIQRKTGNDMLPNQDDNDNGLDNESEAQSRERGTASREHIRSDNACEIIL